MTNSNQDSRRSSFETLSELVVLKDLDTLTGVVCEHGNWTIHIAYPYAWAVDGRELEGDAFDADSWTGMFLYDPLTSKVSFRPKFADATFDQHTLARLFEIHGVKCIPLWLDLVVNIDSKELVSLYFEQALETWIPIDWVGRWDDPLPVLPPEIRSWWPEVRPVDLYPGPPKPLTFLESLRHLFATGHWRSFKSE